MVLGRRQGSVTSQGCSAWRAARAQIYTENHKCINIYTWELLTGNRRTAGPCGLMRAGWVAHRHTTHFLLSIRNQPTKQRCHPLAEEAEDAAVMIAADVDAELLQALALLLSSSASYTTRHQHHSPSTTSLPLAYSIWKLSLQVRSPWSK